MPDTWENLYQLFLGRVRDNLHTCLCFSPSATSLRLELETSRVINGCTIDWFLPWPQDALIAVSTKYIGDFSMACGDEVKALLQEHMGPCTPP